MSYPRRSAVGWITVFAVVVSIATYVLSLVIGVVVIASTDLGGQLANLTGQLLIEAFLLIFPTPLYANGLWLVILSLAVFVVCFIKAATANGGVPSGIRLLLSGSRPRALPNWLTIMPLVGSALFVIVVVLTLIQSTAGVSTGNLTCPPGTPSGVCDAELFAGITTAPLAEEIGFRLTPIGLAVGILVVARLRRHVAQGAKMTVSRRVALFFTAFISPGSAKEKSGLPSIRTSGRKGITTIEWVLLLFTSGVFGAYHVFGGGGWGPGKFLSAALSGFVLGVVYLAYGAFADILLHWFFNFYFYVFAIYSLTLADLVTLGALALGAWGIIIGVYWLAKKPSTDAPRLGYSV